MVAALNEELAPFRILTGIEVDILADGSLDQEDELLARLDVVVGSLHSLLRMERKPMTEAHARRDCQPAPRRARALHRPDEDGTPRPARVGVRRRPGVRGLRCSYDKAVEINSLPPRRDPPRRLMRQALELGCRFSLDSDAHAPGQLAWKLFGCRPRRRRARCRPSAS